MNKAFIFDVDGVIIDTEPIWEKAKKEMFTELLGENIYTRLGSTIGLNIDDTYKKATQLGNVEVSREEFRKAFFSHATKIYQTSPITKGITQLENFLIDSGFSIAAVSASPKDWVDIAIGRTGIKDFIKIVLSLDERADLLHKPAPDGYLEVIKILGSSPESTIILEDSNAGIASAKAAGAYTIGLKENLTEGYIQNGADVYAENLEEVIKLVKKFISEQDK